MDCLHDSCFNDICDCQRNRIWRKFATLAKVLQKFQIYLSIWATFVIKFVTKNSKNAQSGHTVCNNQSECFILEKVHFRTGIVDHSLQSKMLR